MILYSQKFSRFLGISKITVKVVSHDTNKKWKEFKEKNISGCYTCKLKTIVNDRPVFEVCYIVKDEIIAGIGS